MRRNSPRRYKKRRPGSQDFGSAKVERRIWATAGAGRAALASQPFTYELSALTFTPVREIASASFSIISSTFIPDIHSRWPPGQRFL